MARQGPKKHEARKEVGLNLPKLLPHELDQFAKARGFGSEALSSASVFRDQYQTDNLGIGLMLNEYRDALDTIDALNDLVKQVGRIRDALKQSINLKGKNEGLSKMDGDRISITRGEKDVVNLSGADWPVVLADLVNKGYANAVQKRLTAKVLKEAFDNGYRLPKGVKLETVPNLTHKRK